MSQRGVRGLLIPILVVGVVLLAAFSGCLGLFDGGEKSPEEVREEFSGKFDTRYHFNINVIEDGNSTFDSIMFDGTVVGGEEGYMEISGDYMKRNSSTGEEINRTHYSTILRDDRLNITVGEETVSIEDVDRDDLGTTYDVNLTNRTQWSFVTPQEEVNQLLQSDVYDEKEKVDMMIYPSRESVDTVEATRLEPDRDLVAELLNKQYESPMGKRVLDLSGDYIDTAQVHLVKQDPPNSPYMIYMKVQTEDGRQILNAIGI